VIIFQVKNENLNLLLTIIARQRIYIRFDLLNEYLCRLERGNKMLRNLNGFPLFDVTTNLPGPPFDNKGAETADINIFSASHGSLDFLEQLFQSDENIHFGDTSLLGNCIHTQSLEGSRTPSS